MTPGGKLLLYCVFESPEYELDLPGVAGQPIRHQDFEGLAVLYSEFAESPALEQQDVLRFHSVLKSVFDRQAIIPFHFPTLVNSEEELRRHLSENHSRYRSHLSRLRDFVQMELRISNERKPTPASSGRDYMEGKLEQSRLLQCAARSAHEASSHLLSGYKERPADQGLRLYALVRRADVDSFRRGIEQLRPAPSLKILVSGPWPATEFLDD